MFGHFMMCDLQGSLPTSCWVLGSFWSKAAWLPCPTLFIHPVLTQAMFLQRETFWRCGRGKTKNSRNTKRHQNWQVQTLFWAVKNVLIGVSMDRCSYRFVNFEYHFKDVLLILCIINFFYCILILFYLFLFWLLVFSFFYWLWALLFFF